MPGAPEAKEFATSLRVCNSPSVALTFSLEPWGKWKLSSEICKHASALGPAGLLSWRAPWARWVLLAHGA